MRKWVFFILWALSISGSALAHSHHVRYYLHIDSVNHSKEQVDSIARSIRGVRTASWNESRRVLYLNYDPSLTSRRRIQRELKRKMGLKGAR